MKINILGTEYEIIRRSRKEDGILVNHDGYCDGFAKRLVIVDEFDDGAVDNTKDISAVVKKVFRHEITHAYMRESGIMPDQEELVVDWIASQFPKLLKTFIELDCL